MKLAMIAAMTDAGVIGKDNQLPWKLPEDLKRFKQITMGHPIIMGRKTFESLGKPLPGRRNVVLSRRPDFEADGIEVAPNLEEALTYCRQLPSPEGDIAFVIGGAEIFYLALPQADLLYLTRIHHEFPGDVYFPRIDLESGDYRLLEKSHHQSQGQPPFDYTYLTLEKSS